MSLNDVGAEEADDDALLRVLFLAYQTLHRINDLGSFQPRAYTDQKPFPRPQKDTEIKGERGRRAETPLPSDNAAAPGGIQKRNRVSKIAGCVNKRQPFKPRKHSGYPTLSEYIKVEDIHNRCVFCLNAFTRVAVCVCSFSTSDRYARIFELSSSLDALKTGVRGFILRPS